MKKGVWGVGALQLGVRNAYSRKQNSFILATLLLEFAFSFGGRKILSLLPLEHQFWPFAPPRSAAPEPDTDPACWGALANSVSWNQQWLVTPSKRIQTLSVSHLQRILWLALTPRALAVSNVLWCSHSLACPIRSNWFPKHTQSLCSLAFSAQPWICEDMPGKDHWLTEFYTIAVFFPSMKMPRLGGEGAGPFTPTGLRSGLRNCQLSPPWSQREWTMLGHLPQFDEGTTGKIDYKQKGVGIEHL